MLKSIHLFICLCFTLTANSTLTLYAAEKPNILFIFADDWGWGDLSCHGHPYVKTPHIDRLASEEYTTFIVLRLRAECVHPVERLL